LRQDGQQFSVWSVALLTIKKTIVLKKFLSVAAVLTLISIFFISCRSGEDCPAYGKVEVEKVSENC
jgi:hypothetical protein